MTSAMVKLLNFIFLSMFFFADFCVGCDVELKLHVENSKGIVGQSPIVRAIVENHGKTDVVVLEDYRMGGVGSRLERSTASGRLALQRSRVSSLRESVEISPGGLAFRDYDLSDWHPVLEGPEAVAIVVLVSIDEDGDGSVDCETESNPAVFEFVEAAGADRKTREGMTVAMVNRDGSLSKGQRWSMVKNSPESGYWVRLALYSTRIGFSREEPVAVEATIASAKEIRLQAKGSFDKEYADALLIQALHALHRTDEYEHEYQSFLSTYPIWAAISMSVEEFVMYGRYGKRGRKWFAAVPAAD